jgi:hypothetical protein
MSKVVKFDPSLPADKEPHLLLRKRTRSPPPYQEPPKRPKVEITDPKVLEFKQKFEFNVFESNFEKLETLSKEQFGREIVKFSLNDDSEMQVYFYSDSQLKYHKTMLTPYLMIHYTKRPFKKPNAGLLTIYLFFEKKRLFLPIFFAILW